MTVLETFHSFLLLSCSNTSFVHKNQEWRELICKCWLPKIITKDYKLRIIHVNIGAMGHVKMMLRLVFECSGSLDIGKFVDLMMLWTSKLSQSLF